MMRKRRGIFTFKSQLVMFIQNLSEDVWFPKNKLRGPVNYCDPMMSDFVCEKCGAKFQYMVLPPTEAGGCIKKHACPSCADEFGDEFYRKADAVFHTLKFKNIATMRKYFKDFICKNKHTNIDFPQEDEALIKKFEDLNLVQKTNLRNNFLRNGVINPSLTDEMRINTLHLK